MTYTFGSIWIPILLSVAAFGYAGYKCPKRVPNYGYLSGVGEALIGAAYFAGALISTMAIWIIYLTIRLWS